MDHDDDVLYCYEIQTEQRMRRKGLGESENSIHFEDYVVKRMILIHCIHQESS